MKGHEKLVQKMTSCHVYHLVCYHLCLLKDVVSGAFTKMWPFIWADMILFPFLLKLKCSGLLKDFFELWKFQDTISCEKANVN